MNASRALIPQRRVWLCLALMVLVPMGRAESLDAVASSSRADLDKALQALAAAQERVTAERIPLARELSALEEQVIERRKAHEKLQRTYENQLVDLNVLKSEVKSRREEMKYIESLLSEYARVFETRIHISEAERYQGTISGASQALGNPDLSPAQQCAAQMTLLSAALKRLETLVGGDTFVGRALTPRGTVEQGVFALAGPVAVFASADGGAAGIAELQLGSAEPTVIDIGEAFVPGIKTLTSGGAGMLPVDASMGNALKLRATQDSILGHIQKGGPVMFPILLLGFSALVVALLKWIQIGKIRLVSAIELQAVLTHVNAGKKDKALALTEPIRGPVGDLVGTAIRHAKEKKEYLEEVLYEKMLVTKPRLERFMPMIALSAATAPLLGLLGTVTGMINTFNMITVFGTGDPRTLAGGISEALITTEFGLIVAVPSLLLHAWISRLSKGVLGNMEQISVGFINGVPNPEDATGDSERPEAGDPLPNGPGDDLNEPADTDSCLQPKTKERQVYV